MKKLNTRLRHLAQEHDAVMHFVSAMRKVNPETEEDLPELVHRVREVFTANLAPHLEEEENCTLPLLRAAGHAELAEEVFAQHEKMRRLILELGQAPTTEGFVSFVHLLERHVELEENEVWDILDQTIEKDGETPG
mgnify:CR=1 FL=1